MELIILLVVVAVLAAVGALLMTEDAGERAALRGLADQRSAIERGER